LLNGFTLISKDKRYTNDLQTVKKMIKSLEQCWRALGQQQSLDPMAELDETGIFSSYFTKVSNGVNIDLDNLMKEIVFKNCIGCIVNHLSAKASEASVKRLDGSNALIRLSRNERTYGYMFGLLESIKSRFFIREYSCQLSTLEQVFNAFATEDKYTMINLKYASRRQRSLNQ
jgi:hypothetical protein